MESRTHNQRTDAPNQQGESKTTSPEAAADSTAAAAAAAAAAADQVATRLFDGAKPRHRDATLEIKDLQFKEGDLTRRTYTFTCCFEDGYIPDSQYPKYKEYVREFNIILVNTKHPLWKLEGQINTRDDGTGSSVPQPSGRW